VKRDLKEQLLQARDLALDHARPEAVARVHASGHLTARERIRALLDPGSEIEIGILQGKADWGWVHTTGGVDFFGTVNGRPVVASSTDYSDHGGGYGAGYLARLFSLARQHRWPVILFSDGGGSRAQSLEGTGAEFKRLQGRYPGGTGFFEGLAALAGWVPLIAVVAGRSFAGHATLAAFCDVIIATKGSAIGMGGPPMVEAAFGIKISPTELGPVEMHERIGGIDLLVEDEPAAIDAAKRVLAYHYDEPTGPAPADTSYFDEVISSDGTYDMRRLLAALVDEGSLLELRPAFARSVITAFARMDGRTVGILANQPLSEVRGAITEHAADKIARFVQQCNSHGIPILSIIDTPGCTVTDQEGEQRPGISRHHARPVRAFHHRSVPLISVQVGKASGMGACAMSGIGSAHSLPVLRLAWPTAAIGVEDQYSQGFDDVVLPEETREKILKVLRMVGPRTLPAEKARPRDSW